MSGDTKRYYGNVLESLSAGFQQDWRMRFAMSFLGSQAGAVMDHVANVDEDVTPRAIVAYALDVAQEMLTQSIERGLVKDLPDDDQIDDRLRRHIGRNVRAQIFQQVVQQKIAPTEVPPHLLQAIGGLPPFNMKQ